MNRKVEEAEPVIDERRQQTVRQDLETACWTLPAYGGWNVVKVGYGTGEILTGRTEKAAEKVLPISASVKW